MSLSAPWRRRLREKLFLARQLLDEAATQELEGPARESRREGALALLLQARQIYLTLLARLYQHKVERVPDLGALGELVGEDRHDYQLLMEGSGDPAHWWHKLEQLGEQTLKPRSNAPSGATSIGSNLIAVAGGGEETGSLRELAEIAQAMERDAQSLCERHAEE